MTRFAAVPLAAALIAAGSWACASARPGEAEVRRSGPVTVEVTNYNWMDIHAYVLVAGQRQSLGLITTGNTRSFELTNQALASQRGLVLLGLPIGSRLAYMSEEVLVAPGDIVVWRLHNNLRQSTVSVR